VLPIFGHDSIEEAVTEANTTEFGVTASDVDVGDSLDVCTRDKVSHFSTRRRSSSR
jgi:acyl-CoA reductase-like NAD-dependent aldehyde dehydrogenase